MLTSPPLTTSEISGRTCGETSTPGASPEKRADAPPTIVSTPIEERCCQDGESVTLAV